MKRTIIQLASAGDIISLFPLLKFWDDNGDDISMVVRPEHLPIFDSVSYVKPIRWDGRDNDVVGATAFARQVGLPNILVTQVNGNPDVRQERNFIVDQWSRTGEFARFHELPLVFDKRTPEQDAKIVAEHIPSTSIRWLGLALEGVSSPFPAAEKFEAWFRETFRSFGIIMLHNLRLPSVVDLSPLIAECRCLVTVDSAPLHIAYASQTPTIALHRANPWFHSERRDHWIASMTYDECMTQSGKVDIAHAILEELE